MSHSSAPQFPYPAAVGDWSAVTATPQVDPSAWIAPGAIVYGRVTLGARSSVWFGCVLRGDHEHIEVGEDTNLQDGVILHVDDGYPCRLGNRITVGHRAIVHASVVGDGALIGIGALVLSRCIIGEGALIAAGAVVLEGTIVPPRTLWAGCPARQLKELSPEQVARLDGNWKHYVNNAVAHRAAEEQNLLHYARSDSSSPATSH